MKRSIVPLAFLAACLCACSKSPDAVCSSYVELRDKDGRATDGSVMSRCVERLSALEKRSSEAWSCTGGCVSRAKSSTEADDCPWSCEKWNGNGGKSFTGPAEREVNARWKDGIVGDKGGSGAAPGSTALPIINACVTKCKPKGHYLSPEYKGCLKACKVLNGLPP